MGLPEPPFTGACLCGSVQVKVTKPPLLTLACHCRDCQKLTASAYSLTTIFPSEGFSCIGDLITGGLGSNGRTHFYCKTCLGFVYSQIEGADHRINLRTSILDSAAQFAPYVEVMTDTKLPWVDVPAAHSFAQYPASLDELHAIIDEYAAHSR